MSGKDVLESFGILNFSSEILKKLVKEVCVGFRLEFSSLQGRDSCFLFC